MKPQQTLMDYIPSLKKPGDTVTLKGISFKRKRILLVNYDLNNMALSAYDEAQLPPF